MIKTFHGRLVAAIAVALALVLLWTGCAPSATGTAEIGEPATETPKPDGYRFSVETVTTPEPAPLPTVTPVPKELAATLLELKKEGKDDAILPVMEQLKAVDAALGAQWEQVLAYWDATQQEGFVCHDALPEGLAEDNSLCLVGLGYKLNSDGTMRDELLGRLGVLLAAANQYPNAYILVSGGGTASEDLPDITEAGQMAAWLIENGIDPERIIVENQSRSTYENILFSVDKLQEGYPTVTDIAVITSDYHIPRGTLFFTAYFIKHNLPMTVVANAAYTTGRGETESADVLGGGVGRIFGVG